jgi:hypothetical protein
MTQAQLSGTTPGLRCTPDGARLILAEQAPYSGGQTDVARCAARVCVSVSYGLQGPNRRHVGWLW